MIDFDIYYPNPKVEMLMQQLKIRLNKDYTTIKVYMSTTNPYNNLLYKQYIIYNKEVQNAE